MWIGSRYEGTPKELIGLLKFQRAKAAAGTVGWWLHKSIPELSESCVVVPVPTARSRARTRGYDQACLIARRFAKYRNLSYRELLWRNTSTRQVGAGRRERFAQLYNAFILPRPSQVAGKDILLIDDVLTTGATLETAASTLLEYGAARVSAAVYAH
jgi:ComF family protein